MDVFLLRTLISILLLNNSLAKTGMVFTDAYSGAPICAPSRCALVTGRHTGHTTVRGNFRPLNDLNINKTDITFAELLKKGGYSTALFGKWGLGENGTEGVPWVHGFDYYYGILDQEICHNMYPKKIWDHDQEVNRKLE